MSLSTVVALNVGGAATMPGLTATGGVSLTGPGLALSNFVIPTGRELVTSALIEAGAADFIYRDDDPDAVETSDSGEILDGDLEPVAGYRMSLVRHPDANGFIFNDRPEAASISDFFGTGGGGADLTIHVQDDTGVASFVPVDATVFASSDDFIRWDVPDDFETVLARIGTGDRLIIAFTRATPAAALQVGGTETLPGLTATAGVEFVDAAPLEVGGTVTLRRLTATAGVRLRDASTGDQNVRLGADTPDRLYLGANEVDAVHLGG